MLTIIIPAAGKGSRFKEAGYTQSKPFIKARGVPMIQRVAAMFSSVPDSRILAIVNEEDTTSFKFLTGELKGIAISNHQKGAALSVLCANGNLADDAEVVVVNCDNLLDCDMNAFIEEARRSEAFGSMITMKVTDGPWSYVRVWGKKIYDVQEKIQISNMATCGVYYFKSWDLLRSCIMQEVTAGLVTNGEFYLAPCYLFMLSAGSLVTSYQIPYDQFHSLGTPEDLQRYNDEQIN